MRTINWILLIGCLSLSGCGKDEEPPLPGERPVEEEPTVSQDIDLETQFRDVTEVTSDYSDFYYHFRVKSTYSGDVTYGIQHTSNMQQLGASELGEFYVEYSVDDTTFVEIDIPYWTYYSKVNVNPEQFYLLEDAFNEHNNSALGNYEKLVTDVYQPRVIAIVDSLEVIF